MGIDINNINRQQVQSVLDAVRGAKARRSFLNFYKHMKPDFHMNWHVKLLADTVDKFMRGEVRNLIINLPPQHGKFLAGDTPVLTTKGWKRHDELQIGDYVFSDTGQPVAVLGNSGVYNWHVNKVEFAGGEVLYAANEHLWKVYVEKDDHKGRRCVVIDTAEIKKIKHRRAPYILSAPCLQYDGYLPVKEKKGRHKFFIKDIQPHGVVSGNCIQVDGGMYLAGQSLISTHNSTMFSQLLPPYLFGHNPTERVIACSYASTLAYSFNRDVQRLIDSPEYRHVFAGTTLSGKNVASDAHGSWLRNKEEFEVVGHGGKYRAAGVGGGIMGMTATVGIIDDYLKGAAEAGSPTMRNRVWDWYAMDFSSRLNNSSKQLIIATRWHEDDLVGRILRDEQLSRNWHKIVIPAICEQEGAVLGDPRKKGEALFPEKHNIERLQNQRLLSERRFQCLYQQNPKANKDILIYPEYEYDVEGEYDSLAVPETLGLDHGYNDETALVGVKIDPRRRKLFVRVYLYASGITPDALALELTRLQLGRRLIICDNARPEINQMLALKGFAVQAVKKGAGSVFSGIQAVKGFEIVLVPYFVGHGVNTADFIATELNQYEWVVDSMGRPTENPAKSKEHALDAMRYVVMFYAAGRGGSSRFIDINAGR